MPNQSPLKLNSKFILPLAMVFLTAMLAADVLAFKISNVDSVVVSGATIIFPLTYLVGDVISEVYGYDTARKIIWLALICEFVFALLIKLVLFLPYSAFANYKADFDTAIGPMFRFVCAGILGNILSSFLNVYIISKWKIILRGRLFWVRSIVSTAISELLIIGVAIFMGFTSRMNFQQSFHLFIDAYLLEMVYAVIFVWPGWALASFLKKAENIDSYDYDVNYNPFRL